MSLIDVDALRREHERFLSDLRQEIDLAQAEEAEIIKIDLAIHSPFKHGTGALASKTEARVIRTRNGNKLILKNREKYALAQEHGSGTHAGRGKYPITAKNGKALRFMGSGGMMFRRVVMHPGVPATFWLRNAILRSAQAGTVSLESRMTRVARTFSVQRV